jgi:hypothetical protein
MSSVRQVQCSVATCRRLFFLCTSCDRGQIYCLVCGPAVVAATARAKRRRYWRSAKGRRATAARVARHRAKNVTHPGTEELARSETVTSPVAQLVTEASTTTGTESADAPDLTVHVASGARSTSTSSSPACAACGVVFLWVRLDYLSRHRSRRSRATRGPPHRRRGALPPGHAPRRAR